MESLHSESAERPVSLLCAQLETCRSVEEVQSILGELDASTVSGGHAEDVLSQTLRPSRPERLTELVLASGNWAQPLADWLLRTFPKAIDHFLSSIHRQVVEHLSLFLTFLPYPFDQELEQELRQFRHLIEITPKVMLELTTLSFSKPSSPPPSPIMERESEPVGVKVRKKGKQFDRKQARKIRRQAMDPVLQELRRLDIEIPKSGPEVYYTAQLMLDETQDALEEYLALLRRPDIASITHRIFVTVTPYPAPSDTGRDMDESANEVLAPKGPDEVVAYPFMPPMKAVLYFEAAKGFGDWRILVSTRADRHLRSARQKGRRDHFEIYIKKIRELSRGRFSSDNQTRLNGVDSALPTYEADPSVPIYETKMTDEAFLVYQIDCAPEYGSNVEKQAIKVFGIYPHSQIGKRLWTSMGRQLARRGREYHRRCTARARAKAGEDVFRPEGFDPLAQQGKEDIWAIPEPSKDDLEEIHSLLVLDKFVTLSKELLISIFADLDTAHVFDVTPQEMEIIEHPYSCYVLGRSGTGKTTTMMLKLLGIERAYAQGLLSNPYALKPRQVFVTRSRVLVTRVEGVFSKLFESLAVAQKGNHEIKALAEKRRLLHNHTTPLYDMDDDVTWKASSPKRFSHLQDEHFPLFLTFERLVQLLENDMEAAAQASRPPDTALRRKESGQVIDYDIFLEKYWPSFPSHLTKKLKPSLVFSELLGVIEGSEGAMSHESRYLDLASYSNLSHRAQPVFETQRDNIYALFEAYMKRKRRHGDVDAAERTHCLLDAFEEAGVPGRKVDYLYIDEAQDNLLIDAMLLRSLCRNPNGLFWAGDTAQTIAIGSSFTFNELKASVFRYEQRRRDAATQAHLRTFQLGTNYQSHNGIMRCAMTVIDLITSLWPDAIDALAPEQGLVEGPKPIFFTGWDTTTVQYEQFLSGDSGQFIGFGPRQCILVRNEAARTELHGRVGNIGLIMTLYESKGLEFDDVLLYKFFEDSEIEAEQWKVVLKTPGVIEPRHVGVCTELKFLYVAITRSRKNLWIIDRSDKALPMKRLWESRGLVRTCTPDGKIPQLAAGSFPEDWETAGRGLFADRQYSQAVHAFERAKMGEEARVAKAHHLRELARLTPLTSTLDRRDAFRLAAQSFLKCAGQPEPNKLIEKEARVYCHNAGGCYEQAGNCGDFLEDYRCAAGAYESAMEYDSAAKLYLKSNMFKEAVKVVQEHGDEMDADLVETTLEMARLF